MLRRFVRSLPTWARPEHVFLRYYLNGAALSWRHYLLHQALAIGGFVLLTVGTLAFFNALGLIEWSQALSALLWQIVFPPLLLIQIVLGLRAIKTTIATVSAEKQQGRWDNVRVTEGGVALLFRARWAATYYQLIPHLGLVYLIRLALIIGILYDLTAFRGGYLDLLIANVTPNVPLLISTLLVSSAITASLLLPLTAIGFEAALGLLLATWLHSRVYHVVFLGVWGLLRIAALILFGIIISNLITGIETPSWLVWLSLIAFAALGSWGLLVLQLGMFADIWLLLPYSIYLGVALLLVAFAQAFLADRLLDWAIRSAQRST